MTIQNVAMYIVIWESLYRTSRLAIRFIVSSNPNLVREKDGAGKLIECGPSYVVGAIHALFLGLRGVMHSVKLLDSSLEGKIIGGDSDEFVNVELSNVIFLAYVLYDIVHVILLYPKLGGPSMVYHHFGFIICALVCGVGRILAFPFGWQICAELSTPFLTARWLLLTAGWQGSLALQIVEGCFAFTFFLFRGILYSCGISHLLWNFKDIAALASRNVDSRLAHLVIMIIIGGYFLQLMWLSKIVKMVIRVVMGKPTQKTA